MDIHGVWFGLSVSEAAGTYAHLQGSGRSGGGEDVVNHCSTADSRPFSKSYNGLKMLPNSNYCLDMTLKLPNFRSATGNKVIQSFYKH